MQLRKWGHSRRGCSMPRSTAGLPSPCRRGKGRSYKSAGAIVTGASGRNAKDPDEIKQGHVQSPNAGVGIPTGHGQ